MSQYQLPGSLIQRQGADYRSVPVHVGATGGVGTKAVPRSELDNAVTLLETAYENAVAAEVAAREAAIAAIPDGLTSSEVQTLINAAIAGGIRYKGLAEADAANAQDATGETTFATGDLYRISSNGTTAFGMPLNIGDMVIRNDLGGWDKVDNTDPTVTAAANDPIAVSQTTPGNYDISLKATFISRVTSVESGLSTAQSDIDALETSVAANGTDIVALQGSVGAVEAVNTAQGSSIAALQTGLSDVLAVNLSQDTSIASLSSRTTAAELDLATKATVTLVQEVIGSFYASTHRIVSLIDGIFDATAGTTTFYLEPFDTLKFAVVRLSEAAAPYEELGRPKFEYVSVDSNNNSGNFSKLTFFSATQVPNSTIKAYCQKFFDDGETVNVALPSLGS